MQADLRVHGGDSAIDITDLWQWIRAERALAGAVRPVPGAAHEGELGSGLYEVLAVALGSGGAVAALAGSLTAWLKTRRSDVAVTVTSKFGTVTVDVNNARSDQVLPLLNRVLLERAPPDRTLPDSDD